MEEERTKRKKVEEVRADTQVRPNKSATKEVYFTPESWKGVKTVFKCATCGTFRDERDAMIEHVLLHFPKGEQERILETLLKEK